MTDFTIHELKDPQNLTGAAGSLIGMRAGQILFRQGGVHLLSPAVQRAVRDAVQAGPSLKILTTVAEQIPSAPSRSAQTLSNASRSAKLLATSAPRVLSRALGAAAVTGALIDGVIGVFDARRRMKRRELTRDEAVRHVAAESATGAAAGAAAALTCAAVVSVTAAPTLPLLGLGLAAAIATKSAGRKVARSMRWLAPHEVAEIATIQPTTPRELG